MAYITIKSVFERLLKVGVDFNTPKPENVYYTGPQIAETNIYYGNTSLYTAIEDFCLAFFTWVDMDTIEYNYDLSLLQHPNPQVLGEYYAQAPESSSVQYYCQFIEALPQKAPKSPFKVAYLLRDYWNETIYLLDYGYEFYIWYWYTGV